jgi:hypothetical protein
LPEAEWKAIERGWRRGEEGFRAELLAQVRELRAEHYGEEVRQAEEERALAIVKKEPEARGWKEKRRIERREGDPEKLKIAVHLRRKTTMTLRWIARKLPMGSWTYLSNLPGQERTGKKNKSV